MKRWDIKQITAGDEELAEWLTTFEAQGYRVRHIIETGKYVYKIFYTEEDIMEVTDA